MSVDIKQSDRNLSSNINQQTGRRDRHMSDALQVNSVRIGDNENYSQNDDIDDNESLISENSTIPDSINSTPLGTPQNTSKMLHVVLKKASQENKGKKCIRYSEEEIVAMSTAEARNTLNAAEKKERKRLLHNISQMKSHNKKLQTEGDR